MANFIVAHQRLNNQKLSDTKFTEPQEVVKWLGAVQAQDYLAAKWAVGQRAKNMTDATLERTFADGKILRTHILRPTWHFVTPDDIRWMLALTAPHVRAALAYYDRSLKVDAATLRRSHDAIEKTLQGGKQLTRDEISATLKKAGIVADGQRLVHLVKHAELDGVICSGARRGKQFTYSLLDERAPLTRALERDEALTELVKRYFTSRGPATLKDLAWWSGLSIADAQRGLEMVKAGFEHKVVDEQVYWYAASASGKKDASPSAYLLPNYDEYVVGYTDRSAIYDQSQNHKLDARGNFLFQNIIVVDGQVVGTWKRSLKKNEVIVELSPFEKLTKAGQSAVDRAATRYGDFLGLSTTLTYVT